MIFVRSAKYDSTNSNLSVSSLAKAGLRHAWHFSVVPSNGNVLALGNGSNDEPISVVRTKQSKQYVCTRDTSECANKKSGWPQRLHSPISTSPYVMMLPSFLPCKSHRLVCDFLCGIYRLGLHRMNGTEGKRTPHRLNLPVNLNDYWIGSFFYLCEIHSEQLYDFHACFIERDQPLFELRKGLINPCLCVHVLSFRVKENPLSHVRVEDFSMRSALTLNYYIMALTSTFTKINPQPLSRICTCTCVPVRECVTTMYVPRARRFCQRKRATRPSAWGGRG